MPVETESHETSRPTDSPCFPPSDESTCLPQAILPIGTTYPPSETEYLISSASGCASFPSPSPENGPTSKCGCFRERPVDVPWARSCPSRFPTWRQEPRGRRSHRGSGAFAILDVNVIFPGPPGNRSCVQGERQAGLCDAPTVGQKSKPGCCRSFGSGHFPSVT